MEFVINLTNEKLAYITDWCGVKTGAKVNKFEEMRLTKEKANFVSCPMIKESPVSVECKVKEIKELGSHHMFVAEILAIHASEEYIDDNGAFDISKCHLIAYSNGGYYALGKKIGKFGFSVQKKVQKNSKNEKVIGKNLNKKSNKNNKIADKVKKSKIKNNKNKKGKNKRYRK